MVEYTYPYNRDDLVILIPVQLSISRPFYATPYSIAITLCIIAMLYLYFKAVKEPRSLVEVFIIFLLIFSGRSLHQEINTKYFRIFFMSLMVIAFYACTLFNIQILSSLTLKPAALAVKSVEEFARTNYVIYSTKTIKNVLLGSLQSDTVKTILKRMVILAGETDDKLIEERLRNCSADYAVICRKSTALYYLELSNVQGKDFCYNIVPEPIMPSLVTYILAYRSPFQDKFNEVLSRIIENGLVANYTEYQTKKRVKIADEFKPFGMTSSNERSGWVILVFGLVVAFFTFLIEVFLWPQVEVCRE
ncbi:uncharacterized protein LOC126741355 [Anthonomus grandis grandis]|uniref:uncharacterized protein LOC126741355 n=1 Tax=Anthonomus grandis grandis TaxID=2921223 RepID=UPI0021652DC7|nr:uncharacterized protein LOC126741355 [Anthonomus grandis grandis]